MTTGTESGQVTEQNDLAHLAEVAGRFRASSGLGRSEPLHKLFDFLLERTLAGEAPKEIEIAAVVFGRLDTEFVLDASVRVYVHRLRRKLEDYYGGPGKDDAERLLLPKGEYRFQLVEPAVAAESAQLSQQLHAETAPLATAAWRQGRSWLFLLGGLVAGAALMLGIMALTRPRDGLDSLRATPVWADLLASDRPLALVTGDYYIMGERDKPDARPARLVRDFSVNSREQLDELLMYRPELRDRYVDLGLYYLPVSTAYALKGILQVISPSVANRNFTRVVSSSRLTPPTLKNSDIIYVGLLSGLALLEQPIFAGSRFAFGGSYDEIIDSKTGKAYIADPPQHGQAVRRNYAYVALLPGPTGNRILIVAGTRDPAVLQATDILTDPAITAKLNPAGKEGYFEALFAVDGVGNDNLRGTLIAADMRSAQGMWDALGHHGLFQRAHAAN